MPIASPPSAPNREPRNVQCGIVEPCRLIGPRAAQEVLLRQYRLVSIIARTSHYESFTMSGTGCNDNAPPRLAAHRPSSLPEDTPSPLDDAPPAAANRSAKSQTPR